METRLRSSTRPSFLFNLTFFLLNSVHPSGHSDGVRLPVLQRLWSSIPDADIGHVKLFLQVRTSFQGNIELTLWERDLLTYLGTYSTCTYIHTYIHTYMHTYIQYILHSWVQNFPTYNLGKKLCTWV
jgi:hypothetical protein